MNSLPVIGKGMDVDFSTLMKRPVKVYRGADKSSFVEVRVEQARPYGGIFSVAGETFQLGERVIAEFSGEGTCIALNAMVAQTEGDSESQRFILNFLTLAWNQSQSEELPFPKMISSPENFMPLVWADHPWFYKHRLQFKVHGFVAGGLLLDYRNEIKAVSANLELKATIVLPSIGLFQQVVRVTHVDHSQDREVNRCSVVYVSPSEEFLEAVSRYLLSSVAGVSRDRLMEMGLPFPPMEHAASFAYAHDEKSLLENYALRLTAYRNRKGANLSQVTDPLKMKDSYDDNSLIYGMKVGGKLVATGRLVLNDGKREKSEIGSMAELPPWLWKAGFVEFSRFATDEGFRGKDVFASLSLHSSRVAHQLGYRYIVADCEDNLLEMYKRRGARPLGIKFIHPLEGVSLNVIYYDLKSLQVVGRFVAPKMWARTWGEVLKYYQPPKKT